MTNEKKGSGGEADRFLALDGVLSSVVPQLARWLAEEDSFREIRIKRVDEDTVLAIAKGYDSEGGEVVCFGSGAGVVGCLLAINGTVAANRWKVDKPWVPK